MSENRVIGSGNGMPWNVPAEYQQYLQFVTGNTVIMGRKTYEIFGPDLPKSTTVIVVTRSGSIAGVKVAASLSDAISLANLTGKTVFVAGGGSIYEQAIPLADKMYLSTMKGQFTGDTFFPEFPIAEWNVLETRDETEFVFRKYQRRAE